MVVSFELLDLTQPPRLILKNANDRVLGILSRATNVTPEIKYNETSKLTFILPAKVDGEDVPLYHDIAGMQIVDLQGIGQFVLMNPVETGSGVSTSKSCTAYSLEYEFTRKKITIPNGTYKFWDVLQPENTILGMIMSLMPSWSVGTVPVKIANKYRTFEVSNENNYNFIKGTVQKTFNCIFDFDTYTRTVHIHDADESPANHPLYISPDNLAKSIDIKEDDESIVTRLDVNGADGVNIRDVNPNGTNKIINLDYYMIPANFSQNLIDKYFAWKKLNEDNMAPYYNRTVEYAMLSTEKVNLDAKLVDLQNDRISIENIQAVTIQGIAQGIQTQNDLDSINESLAAKDNEIADHKALIDTIERRIELCFDDIQSIVSACDFDSYFTEAEHIQMDRYIKDDEIAESTFVAETSAVYTDDVAGSMLDEFTMRISDSSIDVLDSVSGSYYCAKSGKVSIGDILEGEIILATVDIASETSTVSLYLHNAKYQGEVYLNACVSITGSVTSTSETPQDTLSAIELTFENGYIYFSVNISEFGKRSVAWDLFEYGCAVLDKVSKPTYTFSITSANFLIEDQFESFKKTLKLGERVYTPCQARL